MSCMICCGYLDNSVFNPSQSGLLYCISDEYIFFSSLLKSV